jgi:hypothetical protein
LSEIREWQYATVLVIRKAFTFDDIDFDFVECTPVLDTGFVPAVKRDGYGFYREDSWILAYPDAKTNQIVVSKHIDGKTSTTRINTVATTYQFKPNPEAALQREIIDFLALTKLKEKPIDW